MARRAPPTPCSRPRAQRRAGPRLPRVLRCPAATWSRSPAPASSPPTRSGHARRADRARPGAPRGQRLFVLDPAQAVAGSSTRRPWRRPATGDRLDDLARRHPVPVARDPPGPGRGRGHPADRRRGQRRRPAGAAAHRADPEEQGRPALAGGPTSLAPREDAMAAVVGEAIASGRRSRAIYPARALQDARPTLVARAEVGEQIRIVPELPSRLFLIGADPRDHARAARLRRRAAAADPPARRWWRR